MTKSFNFILFVIFATIAPVAAQTAWQSELVKVDEAGHITYHKDIDGFVIPDFSYAGYKSGEAIPDYQPPSTRIETVTLITNADNTANIQQAINKIAALTPDANGFRGVVKLNAGRYLVDGTINLNASGIILRGAGRGPDKSTASLTETDLQDMTLIYRRGTGAALATNVIVMGPSSAGTATWGNNTSNETSKVNITTDKVMPGDFSFEVQSRTGYAVGDAVCIKYPTTEKLLESIWYGGNSSWVINGNASTKWKTSDLNICYHRYITKIEGNMITLDAPIFYCMDKQYSQAYMHKITTGTVYTNIGVENLRISMDRTPVAGFENLTPDQNCIKMNALENCWAKGLHLSDFIHAGIKTEAVTRSTIENCRAVDCSGHFTGANQYNFNNYSRSQLILFKDCFGRNGRHHWVSNGTTTVSGIVVLNFTSTQSSASSEGHRYLSQGLLIDGWKETGSYGNNTQKLGFFLRDNMGTNHGWGAIFSVMWNCDVQNGAVYLDKVPTGQNYAIGTIANTVRKYNSNAKYTTGYNEGQNKPGLFPKSLYEAQLNARKIFEIIEHPQNIQTCVNTTINLSATVQTPQSDAVTFRWKKNGTIIEGATQRTLVINNATLVDAGIYTFEALFEEVLLESEPAEVAIFEHLPELHFFNFPEAINPRKTYQIAVVDPMEQYPNATGYQWDYTGRGVYFEHQTTNPVHVSVADYATSGIFQVRVLNPCGTKTITQSVSIEKITGYSDKYSNNIKIYPNPANDALYIQNIENIKHIEIINAAGLTVYSQTLADDCSELVLSVSDYPSGAYVVRFKLGSGQEKTYKTIIKR